MNNEIVVSGIRPTGYLHIGNYFGAIRNFLINRYIDLKLHKD
jgi:tryptophanyl-tRNA synthetase